MPLHSDRHEPFRTWMIGLALREISEVQERIVEGVSLSDDEADSAQRAARWLRDERLLAADAADRAIDVIEARRHDLPPRARAAARGTVELR